MLDRYDHNLLLDYLEGELDPAQRAKFEATLKDDPELAALLDAMSGDRQLLRSLPREEVPGELRQDLTQTLERRMLMDESLGDAGPIPIARGRALGNEPVKGSGFRRVAGLSGLAASVAIAAGLVVYMLPDDPLEHTANRLAESSTAGQGDTTSGSEILDNLTADDPGSRGAADPEADGVGGSIAETLAREADRIARADAEDEAAIVDPAAGAGAEADGGALSREEFAWINADQQTAGIASIQPRRQLVVFSEQPELSREQLVAHCINNGIPIVQGDANLNGRVLEQQRGTDDFNAQQLDGNYALLINEQQLDDLLVSFNNDVVLDTEQIGQRAAIASQAAVVEPLSEVDPSDQLADVDPAQDPRRSPDFDLNRALTNTTPYEAPNARDQQAIQLYLPEDLGSSYANTRNRDNFNYEQRRNAVSARNAYNYEQPPNDTHALEEAEASDVATEQADDTTNRALEEPKEEHHARQANPTPNEAAPGANPDKQLVDGSPVPEAIELDSEAKQDQPKPAPVAKSRSVLDPQRSNWLAPHLPLTETTLILNWRLDTTSEPAQLVPIQIMVAPAEEVRTLRLRQQVETANRRRLADPELSNIVEPEAAEQIEQVEGEADAAVESETPPTEEAR